MYYDKARGKVETGTEKVFAHPICPIPFYVNGERKSSNELKWKTKETPVAAQSHKHSCKIEDLGAFMFTSGMPMNRVVLCTHSAI